jgi:hypothetical protein
MAIEQLAALLMMFFFTAARWPAGYDMSMSSGAEVSFERDSPVHGKYYLEHILPRCSDAQTDSRKT